MILLCGIPSEPPLARVQRELVDMGVSHVLFNQRHAANSKLDFEVGRESVTGTLTLEGADYELDSFTGAYTRLMDVTRLPELADEPAASPRRAQTVLVHDELVRWLEVTPGRVVNRSRPMASNSSKPYQAQLIKSFGFATPETLITNDPEAVRVFRAEFGRVVYKSISGVRSIVSELTDDDLSRLHTIRWCPVQFQQYVHGLDIRVHVVGERVFATAIHSNGTDYRYVGNSAEGEIDLNPYHIDDTVAATCVALTNHLGLSFSGIDLRVSPDGKVYCFEVNPSPAFSFYESHTGQPIARAVASYLVGDSD